MVKDFAPKTTSQCLNIVKTHSRQQEKDKKTNTVLGTVGKMGNESKN